MEEENTASRDLYISIINRTSRSLADAEILRCQQTNRIHAVQSCRGSLGHDGSKRQLFMDVEARKKVFTLVCCATSGYVLGS